MCVGVGGGFKMTRGRWGQPLACCWVSRAFITTLSLLTLVLTSLPPRPLHLPALPPPPLRPRSPLTTSSVE